MVSGILLKAGEDGVAPVQDPGVLTLGLLGVAALILEVTGQPEGRQQAAAQVAGQQGEQPVRPAGAQGAPRGQGAAGGGGHAAQGLGVGRVDLLRRGDPVGDAFTLLAGEAGLDEEAQKESMRESMKAMTGLDFNDAPARIATIASTNLSSSARDSDSVGSTMRVPATGNDRVGAWKP